MTEVTKMGILEGSKDQETQKTKRSGFTAGNLAGKPMFGELVQTQWASGKSASNVGTGNAKEE